MILLSFTLIYSTQTFAAPPGTLEVGGTGPRVLTGVVPTNSAPGAEYSISIPGPVVYLYGSPGTSQKIEFGGQNISLVTTGDVTMRSGGSQPIEGFGNTHLTVIAKSLKVDGGTYNAEGAQTLSAIYAAGTDICANANCSGSTVAPTLDYQNFNVVGPEATSVFQLHPGLLEPNASGNRVHLGEMKMTGLIATGAYTPWKSVTQTNDLSGFKTNFIYPDSMQTNPPQSMTSGTFSVGALEYATIMVSTEIVDTAEAIAFVSGGGAQGEEAQQSIPPGDPD